MGVEDFNGRHGINRENEKQKEEGNSLITKKVRYFWDGGIIANTPLREAVIEHRRYWASVRKSEVPPLRVFIVNVHPIKQDSLPADYDALVDRKNDLTYHDRTLFDERMAIMITDYVNIVNSLIKLAEDNKVKKALVDNILEQQAETRNFSSGKHLKYTDLVKHMVSVEQVIRIVRKNDAHTIANKTFDFSSNTIKKLIRDGYEETLEQETEILQCGTRSTQDKKITTKYNLACRISYYNAISEIVRPDVLKNPIVLNVLHVNESYVDSHRLIATIS